ncbi:AraC family transcriptional regulator [Yersinia frederiksenii]|jgi:AraC-like DNA-binding protein|uniref:AraC family transcriptional regulator n=1 Tax=Yersinia frederiksenii TaxID=29484 RepID=UPI0005E80697|nr:helix-turn-helix transcriptional regulator [Yersinia frederiksenii]CQH20504.1 putative AraC family regulatory protein [Yersinia frederiksenii]
MKINPEDSFNPDKFDELVIGIASDMGAHDSGMHSHLRHQLLFSAAGSITIELDNTLCLLPPRRAAWIPAGTVHRAIMNGAMAYRSLYFSSTLPLSALPMQIVEVNPLFFEVIERMAFWHWGMPEEQQLSLITVFCEEINNAQSENWTLRYPSDIRLSAWLDRVRRGELPPRLGQLAQKVGACERTISRLFIKDTGMNYQSWRQQWRLLKAMEMLCDGWLLSQVAQQLDFVSDSAFIVFFRHHTGTTPTRYLRHSIAESQALSSV